MDYSFTMSGAGIAEPIGVKVFDYSYDPKYALDWFLLGDGNWKALDRGEARDHAKTTIEVRGKEGYINSIITAIDANRTAGGELTLTGVAFALFGQDVDYSLTVSAVVSGYELRKQRSLRRFTLSIELNPANITRKDYASLGLPALKRLKRGYTGDTDQAFNVVESYNNNKSSGEINISRWDSDKGYFEGVFIFNYDEMWQLLDFRRRNRSNEFTLPTISGVDNPFGVLAGAAPYEAKLYNISDVIEESPNRFSAKIAFVQHFG